MADRRTFVVVPEDAGQRLDRYLAAQLPGVSRARVQELMAEGLVRAGGKAAKPAHRVAAGEPIEVELRLRPLLAAAPEALPLEVLYEDGDVVVVNKPAGMAVHAGAGVARGTLVNALMHRFGALSRVGGPLRPGIVHRLDKLTSGALVVARNDPAHQSLARQFLERRVEKTYLALLHGRLTSNSGTVSLAIARDLRRRTRMTTRRAGGRAARTDWRVLARLEGFTLVEVALHTGRTHQVRVHFSALGHPVVGDTLYGAPRQPRAGGRALAPLGRNFLHAARISFLHPRTAARLSVRAPLAGELRSYLHELARALGEDPASIDAALRAFL
jgi:23S rRNA pseudouridine1911/1915/1917 synthase